MTKQTTVLVVDDSPVTRALIHRELVSVGYDVIVAVNGMEALSVLEGAAHLPDVITLDIDMPAMGGFEVCQRLRSERDSSDERKRQAAQIPIIFVSANDSVEHRERGYQLEVIDFISKPFLAGDITRAVDTILNPKEQFPGMKALVVDDSQAVRRIVRNNLNRSGVQVFEATSGEDALALIEKKSTLFDIFIFDQMMPGMRGEEFCRRLSAMEGMQQIPKFLISSMNDKESILSFFKAGASDYLKKPFIAEELHARIETQLRLRKYVQQLEELNKKLEQQATRDALTGLYNRRYFQEASERIFANAIRQGHDISCVMLDLDYFKNVNDRHGHAFGDMVLSGFAGLLTNRIRKADIAARIGGEEFVLFLPSTGVVGAEQLAECIREQAENNRYGDGEKELQITCSIGISSLAVGRANSPEDLISQADKALYIAKEKGRNRVVVYGRGEQSR